MLKIRSYIKEDSIEIVKWIIDEKSFYIWSANRLGDYPLKSETLDNEINNNKYFPYVMVDNNKVVGFFILRYLSNNLDELRLGFIIVDSSIRGKGYGKAMLKLALDLVFNQYNAKKASLGVFKENQSAYNCYKSIGFKDTNVRYELRVKDYIFNGIEMEIIK